MISLAICDDNAMYIARLSSWLGEYSARKAGKAGLEVRQFSSGLELLDAYEAGERFHVVLLDIVMPLVSGIDAAREIRIVDKVVKIIFLTSSPEYALASYKVRAFSYLLKSSGKEELFSLLDEAIREIEIPVEEGIVVKGRRGLERLALSNIAYAEVRDKTVFYHLADGDPVEVPGKLSDQEKPLLEDERFLKPHRSFIVNTDHVAAFARNAIVMRGGGIVPVPKESFSKVKAEYLSRAIPAGKDNP